MKNRSPTNRKDPDSYITFTVRIGKFEVQAFANFPEFPEGSGGRLGIVVGTVSHIPPMDDSSCWYCNSFAKCERD